VWSRDRRERIDQVGESLDIARAWVDACDRGDVDAALIGRRSGIKVDREWSYVFTVANGKLLRQVGFDQAGEALRSAGLA
jgi:hypothetical protein